MDRYLKGVFKWCGKGCGKGLARGLAAGICLSFSYVQAGQFDPARIQWSHLTFSASVVFFTINADIDFRRLNAREVASQLLKPGAGEAVQPGQEPVYVLSTHTNKFKRNSTLEFWFEGDLTALQRTQTETGRKNIVRTYRFLQDGVYRHDILPTEGETDLPPGRWSRYSKEYYPYSSNLPPLKMTDNNVIFYAVSAANLQHRGDKVEFLTFDKEHINRVELAAQGYEEIDVDYVVNRKSGSKHVYDTVSALRISIRSRPLNKNIDKDNFVFLGVKGDIDIYIDPKTRIPLQVSGKADYLGHTDITLSRATLE